MPLIQYLRLFAIVSGLLVGLWFPLNLLGFLEISWVDLSLNVLISVVSAVNLYIHFTTSEVSGRNWREWTKVTVVADLVCLLPLPLIQRWLFHEKSNLVVLAGLLVARHIWKIKAFLEEFQNLKPIVYRLVPLGMMMPLLVHLLACGWIALGGGNAEPGPTAFDTYVKAFYWAMTTLTTVGYGDISAKTNPQMFYAAGTQVLGVGVFGYVLSNVASLLSRLDAAREHHMDNLDQIETFMNSYRIPLEVRGKVRSYYHYVWKMHKGRLDRGLLSQLPSKLQSELNFSINSSIIEGVSFLKNASRELLEELMLALDHRIFVPGERIFRAGDPGDCLYMVHAGKVDILTADGKLLATLNEGAVFGEMALIADGPRTATARAAGYCDLYVLSKEAFNRIVTAYPDFKAELQLVMQERQKAQAAQKLKAS